MSTRPVSITDVNGRRTVVYRRVQRDADGKPRLVTRVISSVTTEETAGVVWQDATGKFNELASIWEGGSNPDANEKAAELMSSGFDMGDAAIDDTMPELRDILSREDDYVDVLEPHYRLYASEKDGGVVICVQDFDYYDYDKDSFIGKHNFKREDDAEQALEFLRDRIVGI